MSAGEGIPVPMLDMLDAEFVWAGSGDAEQDGAGDAAEQGANGHEGEKHQHGAVAFEIAGLEQFDPRNPGTEAERAAAEKSEDETQQDQQDDFHCNSPGHPNASVQRI